MRPALPTLRRATLLGAMLLGGACARREQAQLRITAGPSCTATSAQDLAAGLGPGALRRARSVRVTLTDAKGGARAICVAVNAPQDAAGLAAELRQRLVGEPLLRELEAGAYAIALLGTASDDCAPEQALVCGQATFTLPASGPVPVALHCYDAAADTRRPRGSPPFDFGACAAGPAPRDAGPPDSAADRGPPPLDGAPPPDSGPPPPRYAFAVFGGGALDTSSCTAGVAERLAVPAAIAARQPTFVLNTGDLMARGYEAGAYAKLVSCYAGLLAKAPFFPTLGDYDAGSGAVLQYRAYLEEQLATRNAAAYGAAAYAASFTVVYGDDPTPYSTDFDHPTHLDVVPSGVSFKTFYAFRYANAYFLSFEVGTRWWIDTPTTWVEKHLKAARADPSVEHVFVLLHHPFYSTTMDEQSDSECIAPVRAAYEALLRRYDVTMVFSGHANLYDRFYVPDSGAATRRSPPPQTYAHDGKAVHYIVTAGGGGALNPCALVQDKSYAYAQRRSCDYHFVHVQVDGRTLQVSAIRVGGDQAKPTTSVIDSFAVR